MATCCPNSPCHASPGIHANRDETRRQRRVDWHAVGARLLAALARSYERTVRAPLRRWRLAQRTQQELMLLDERMLRDIGLDREDLSDMRTRRKSWMPLDPYTLYHLPDITSGRIYPRIPEPRPRHNRRRDLS